MSTPIHNPRPSLPRLHLLFSRPKQPTETSSPPPTTPEKTTASSPQTKSTTFSSSDAPQGLQQRTALGDITPNKPNGLQRELPVASTNGSTPSPSKSPNTPTTGASPTSSSSTTSALKQAYPALFSAIESGKVLKEGSGGAAVSDLQKLLTQRGYSTNVDGKYGPQTSASVRAFQGANRVMQNGQVGATTLKALQEAKNAPQSGPNSRVLLNVPFYNQLDNYTMPERTCNSSANAMAAKFLGANISGDDAYLERVLRYGDTTDHSAQTHALNDYGIKSGFHYDLDFKDIDHALAKGKPVVLGINHRGSLQNPTGGHMITVIGKEGNNYIVHDPYGSLHDNYTGSVNNGKAVSYSRDILEARWTVDGPHSGWGRIFH